jgi:hypothetical protein
MTQKTENKKKRISITIDGKILDEAQTSCSRTGRKLSSWIEILIEKELKANY